MSIHHFSDANFKKDVLESDVPVLVDFWAHWCVPCRKIGPIIEELAHEYKGKMKIGKVDVDSSPRIATEFGVMSIPTLIFFKHGKVHDQISGGAHSKHELKRKIDEILQ